MISRRVFLPTRPFVVPVSRSNRSYTPKSTATDIDHDITFAFNSPTIRLLDSCPVPNLNVPHEKKVNIEDEAVKIEEISSYKRARSPENLAEASARPAKRRAVLVSADSLPNSSPVEEPQRICDEKYYYDEGNWVILVGHTLFKLPHFLFLKHCSGVQELFQLPVDKDLDLITERDLLQVDEDVEDFRALSWGLTADPEEITQQIDPLKANSEMMLRLLYMTRKYKFDKHARWANETVTRLCKQLTARPLDEFKRLLSLSEKQGLSGVVTAMTTECIRRLDSRAVSSKEMLDFAEFHNLRRLQGWVYYAELLLIKPSKEPPSTAFSLPSNSFSLEQQFRLLRGFWSLSQFWDSIKTPPSSHNGVAHTYHCLDAWMSMWDRTDEKPAFDPLVKLYNLGKQTVRPPKPADRVVPRCNCNYRTHAREVSDALADTLADHFLGPPK